MYALSHFWVLSLHCIRGSPKPAARPCDAIIRSFLFTAWTAKPSVQWRLALRMLH